MVARKNDQESKARSNITVVPPSATSTIVPMKLGLFGDGGTGKSTTAMLIALALSVQHYNRAPVIVTDTEPGWQFFKPMFKAEGVELVQRTVPTFKAMCQDLHEGQRLGACVWVGDVLTVIWEEFMNAFKRKRGFIPQDMWQDIRMMWRQDFVTPYRNSPLNCIGLGRTRDLREDILEDSGKINSLKTGSQLNAGGSQSFGYEPDVLIELTNERKPKRLMKFVKEENSRQLMIKPDEGRMIHRADVLKDRTWVLNGRVFRWSDKEKYQKGGYRQVWESFKPHFLGLQDVGTVQITEGESTASILSDSGASLYHQRQQRRDILAAELHAAMDILFAGQTAAARWMRLRVFEHIFGFRSKEAADAASLDVIERGVRILQAFENRTRDDETILSGDSSEILAELDRDINAFDDGEVEEEELPI